MLRILLPYVQRIENVFFGEIIEGKMKLSAIGIIADIIWHEIKNHAKDIELGEFVVMPNHVHGILVLNGGGGNKDVDCNNDNNVGTKHALSLPQQLSPQQSPQQNQKPNNQKNNNSYCININNPSFAQQRFQNQGSNTLSSIISSYKSAVSKHAHRLGFDFARQSRFHDHIIRNDSEYQRIKDYIINNPIKWNNDKFNQTND